MGINRGRKQLDYHQTMICSACGRYGNYQVYMLYSYLSLFFIPIFKWGRSYVVTTSCCGTTYSLNPEKGKEIEGGLNVEIKGEDLTIIQGRQNKTCHNCGYQAEADFEYCPKCGSKLD